MKEKDNSTYEGDWVNDMYDGQGVKNYANGSRYNGHWSRGVKKGQGQFIYNNGTRYDGNWADDMVRSKVILSRCSSLTVAAASRHRWLCGLRRQHLPGRMGARQARGQGCHYLLVRGALRRLLAHGQVPQDRHIHGRSRGLRVQVRGRVAERSHARQGHAALHQRRRVQGLVQRQQGTCDSCQ